MAATQLPALNGIVNVRMTYSGNNLSLNSNVTATKPAECRVADGSAAAALVQQLLFANAFKTNAVLLPHSKCIQHPLVVVAVGKDQTPIASSTAIDEVEHYKHPCKLPIRSTQMAP
jgi:hypothetical protein